MATVQPTGRHNGTHAIIIMMLVALLVVETVTLGYVVTKSTVSPSPAPVTKKITTILPASTSCPVPQTPEVAEAPACPNDFVKAIPAGAWKNVRITSTSCQLSQSSSCVGEAVAEADLGSGVKASLVVNRAWTDEKYPEVKLQLSGGIFDEHSSFVIPGLDSVDVGTVGFLYNIHTLKAALITNEISVIGYHGAVVDLFVGTQECGGSHYVYECYEGYCSEQSRDSVVLCN